MATRAFSEKELDSTGRLAALKCSCGTRVHVDDLPRAETMNGYQIVWALKKKMDEHKKRCGEIIAA